jgi:hypothetical protein
VQRLDWRERLERVTRSARSPGWRRRAVRVRRVGPNQMRPQWDTRVELITQLELKR